MTGLPPVPNTDPPLIMDAENWSRTLGFFNGRSERRTPSKLGLVAAWTLEAMMGGSGPWKFGGNGKSAFPFIETGGGPLCMAWGPSAFLSICSGREISLRRSPPPRNLWRRPVSPWFGLDCGCNDGWFCAGLLRFFSWPSCCCRCCSDNGCSPWCLCPSPAKGRWIWSPGGGPCRGCGNSCSRFCPADGCLSWRRGPFWGCQFSDGLLWII